MSDDYPIQLPPIVIVLRVVGGLCPIGAFVLAGTSNATTSAGWMMIVSGLILTLLFCALGSVIRLLNRIDQRQKPL